MAPPEDSGRSGAIVQKGMTRLHKAQIAEGQMEYEGALRQLELVSEAGRVRRMAEGFEYYDPNPAQLRAHKSLARTILFVGGNRSGKSTFGAIELVYHLTRRYPAWYPEAKKFTRPIKAVISATEFPIITRVIEPKLIQYLPRGYYHLKRTAQGYLTRLTCKDGSTVDILTSEMKDDAYEGADWDIAWEDEPQQKRKRDAILRGLVDRSGREIITFTPLTEPWMKYDLIDKADGRKIAVFQVDMRDNKFTINGDPILSEEAIEAFESTISEEYRDTRVHGTFFFMRGLVYKTFGAAHLKEFTYQFPDSVICVLDPHDRNPHHMIWAYVDRTDDIFIDYELITHCELDELAIKILAIEKERGYKMRRRLIDPNFGRKPARTGSNASVMQELARFHTSFYEANDNIELGHMITRDYLHYDMRKPITAVNKPKLFFSPDRVPATIRSLRNHQYEEWQGKTKDDRDPKEHQKEKDTHGADCIRYLCISKPTSSKMESKIYGNELAGAPY